MRILGIDQSMDGNAGFALVDLDAQTVICTHLELYKIKDGQRPIIPKHDTRWRCVRFAALVQRLLKDYAPDIVVTELVRAFHQDKTNTNTISALSEIQGALNVVVPRTTPLYKFNTSSWQAVVLRWCYLHDPGVPKKDKVKQKSIDHVKLVFGLDLSSHEADAINMCLAYPILSLKADDPANKYIVERL